MGSPTKIYVDPAIAANSGTGTIGDPYGDLQYALNTMSRDATNGNQINIKAGTDEILAAALTLATYGTPGLTAPLVFRGYASAADDGGVGGINNNSFTLFTLSTYDSIFLVDLHIHNGGSATLISLDAYCHVINCKVHNTSGGGIVLSVAGTVIGCEVYDVNGPGISAANTHFNYLYNSTKSFGTGTTAAIYQSAAGGITSHNIISIGGASQGITANYGGSVINNSVLSGSGTGIGILHTGSNRQAILVVNNVVEGFSGAGGKGIAVNGDLLLGSNHCYNNTTNYSNTDVIVNLGDNEDLSGSTPFAKSGANTFANRFVYFAPLDVGNMRGDAYPTGCNRDKGAVQHADAGGAASMLAHRGMVGGMTG